MTEERDRPIPDGSSSTPSGDGERETFEHAAQDARAFLRSDARLHGSYQEEQEVPTFHADPVVPKNHPEWRTPRRDLDAMSDDLAAEGVDVDL